jgi:hypothetical protein
MPGRCESFHFFFATAIWSGDPGCEDFGFSGEKALVVPRVEIGIELFRTVEREKKQLWF